MSEMSLRGDKAPWWQGGPRQGSQPIARHGPRLLSKAPVVSRAAIQSQAESAQGPAHFTSFLWEPTFPMEHDS